MMEKMEVRGGPSSDLGRGRERGGRKKSDQWSSQAENLKKMHLAQIQESENHGKNRGEKSQAFAHSSTEENGRTGERKRREEKKASRGGARQKI
jgi:hypothetical protein